VIDVAVVGAGSAGLATARELRRRGIEAVVLERSSVGASWRAAYDSLELNTERDLSALPGLPLPADAGTWVRRDRFVCYLEQYADGLDVRTADVERLDPVEGGWSLVGTGLTARQVVVATGASREPVVPSWGETSLPVVHSGAYREPTAYAGQVVLVVGGGNSGSEIAHDLAGGPARHVLLAVRTPPALLPKQVGRTSLQRLTFAVQPVPSKVADVGVRALLSVSRLGDRRRGLRVPADVVSAARRGRVTAVDTGLRRDVRRGRVTVVPAVVSVAGRAVRLADGSSVTPDAVVAATGWRPGLEPLVGHLRTKHRMSLLDRTGRPTAKGADEALPGLRFVGFAPTITGFLREGAFEAELAAQAIAGESALARAVTSVRRRLPVPA
jgi:putative flavoprotein involved in K+ transport